MNYKETLDYLFSQLPMFQRIGKAAYKADLDNTRALIQILDHPEQEFPAIHIAGTNGKGSVSNIVASVLQASGFKTGLFTSPHLHDFRERIRVNGKMVPQNYVVDFVNKYRYQTEKIDASFFELTFGLAMRYFADMQIDIAVVEVGMGGRLDSTNVVNPVLTAITNISKDHMAFLGQQLEQIAKEKAGIIKGNVPIVIGRYQEETWPVFESIAKSLEAPMVKAWQETEIMGEFPKISIRNAKHNFQDIISPLTGIYQKENIALAFSIIDVLSEQKVFSKVMLNFKKGLENLFQNTGFRGRWQQLGSKPKLVCDTGHNEDGIRSIITMLKQEKYHKLHLILGFVNDKNVDFILSLFPRDAQFYFCQAQIPRALDVDSLMSLGKEQNLNCQKIPNIKQAVEAVRKEAHPDDFIFVGGSTFVVAELFND